MSMENITAVKNISLHLFPVVESNIYFTVLKYNLEVFVFYLSLLLLVICYLQKVIVNI